MQHQYKFLEKFYFALNDTMMQWTSENNKNRTTSTELGTIQSRLKYRFTFANPRQKPKKRNAISKVSNGRKV